MEGIGREGKTGEIKRGEMREKRREGERRGKGRGKEERGE